MPQRDLASLIGNGFRSRSFLRLVLVALPCLSAWGCLGGDESAEQQAEESSRDLGQAAPSDSGAADSGGAADAAGGADGGTHPADDAGGGEADGGGSPLDVGPTQDVGAPSDAGGSNDAGGPPRDGGMPSDDAGLPPQDGGQQPQDSGAPADAGGTEDGGESDAGQTDLGGPDEPCPPGVVCVESFPFAHRSDTGEAGQTGFDFYGCRPGTDESGPELVYGVVVPEAGFLSAAVEEDEGVDVDVHLLGSLDPDDCLDRGNYHARADVEAGLYFVVVDTYVSGGVPQSGGYQVRIGLTVPSSGPCAMEGGVMPRVGDGGDHLPMPATGPMVLEAHLVTQAEPYRPDGPTEHLTEHYALSEATTSFVMHRREEWAPLEGGDFYGCGIGSPDLFPVEHEAWYVNMYWTRDARPDRGTRMIVRLPGSGRAVVVAAGYETGPGNLERIGGTPEETHFYLGTGHADVLTLGIATDQSLPLGPRRCTD